MYLLTPTQHPQQSSWQGSESKPVIFQTDTLRRDNSSGVLRFPLHGKCHTVSLSLLLLFSVKSVGMDGQGSFERGLLGRNSFCPRVRELPGLSFFSSSSCYLHRLHPVGSSERHGGCFLVSELRNGPLRGLSAASMFHSSYGHHCKHSSNTNTLAHTLTHTQALSGARANLSCPHILYSL